MSINFVDSSTALITFLDQLPDCKGQPPSLYIDLEGSNLSRHGTLSLITIFVQPQASTYLIDVCSLGQDAFVTESTRGLTLKDVFEADDICKVFFDIRNDSDVLFSLHEIHVRNVEDLQLIELASRTFQKKFVNGLAKCIERDSSLSYSEKFQWQKVKTEGHKLFDPTRGGSYAVFDERPLSRAVMDYCIQDVAVMPQLRERYLSRLCDAWYLKIREECKERIRLSQSPSFNGQGRHMALGPTGWQHWNPSPSERGRQTLFQTTALVAAPQATQAASEPTTSGHVHELSDVLSSLDLHETTTRRYDHSDEEPEASYGYESDGNDSVRDFAACDQECGYCGKCPY